MPVKIVINDLVCVGIVVSNDLVVEIGVKCSGIQPNKCASCIYLFHKIKISVPRGFGIEVIDKYHLSCTGKCGMVFSKDIGDPVTISKTQAQYVVFVV